MVTTAERIGKVETKIDLLHEDIKEIKSFMRSLNNSFASKWVEKVTVGIIIMIIGSAVVIALKGGI